MSVKSNILGAAATLTIVGGSLSTVGTVPADAATPQCGSHCIEVFSPRFGTPTQPNFVETALGGAAKVGRPAVLYSASSSNPAEDWMVPTGGPVPVSEFYAKGLVSAVVNSHYGSLMAAQIEFAALWQGERLVHRRGQDHVRERRGYPTALQRSRWLGVDHRPRGCAPQRSRVLRLDQRLDNGLFPPVRNDLHIQAPEPDSPRPP